MHIVTSHGGLTRPSSVYISWVLGRDVVPTVIKLNGRKKKNGDLLSGQKDDLDGVAIPTPNGQQRG